VVALEDHPTALDRGFSRWQEMAVTTCSLPTQKFKVQCLVEDFETEGLRTLARVSLRVDVTFK
jgi:hypothetical protein